MRAVCRRSARGGRASASAGLSPTLGRRPRSGDGHWTVPRHAHRAVDQVLLAPLPSPPAPLLVAARLSSLAGGVTSATSGRAVSGGRPVRVIRAPVALHPSRWNRGDEARPRVGQAEPARLEHVAQQEEAGQREAIGDILRRGLGARPSRARKAGSRNSLSCHGSPACRDTARPDFGDT